MSARHGEYVDGLGYFDVSRKGYVDKPSQVTPMRDTSNRKPKPFAEVQFSSAHVSVEDRRRQGNARAFRPDPQMESLRRLRDSDKPEERQTFQRLAAGSSRMSLGSYEANLRDYLAEGGELPEGVATPREG